VNPVSAFGSTIHFQLEARDTRGALCLGLATTPPGVAPPLHVHAKDDEVFIVVSGSMAFHTPDGWHDVEPGTVVFMPRGVPHTFRNRGTTPSQHWVLTAPSGFEDFYARTAALFAKPGPPDFPALRGIAAEYGYTILGPAPGD
jgi:mannose-6-phosphate isomerase-like protein (cupin superfamily)